MPFRRRTSTNDNKRNAPPLQRYAGTSTAPPREPGGLAASLPPAPTRQSRPAVEFNTNAWKLIAVRRFEIA